MIQIMKKGSIFIAWCLILTAAIAPAMVVHGSYYSRTRPYAARQQQITKLNFYFHDMVSGSNATSVMVASAKATGPSGPFGFGRVFAIDDPITLGPNLTSGAVIGNCQGMYQSSSRSVVGLVVFYDFLFTTGRFNGSAINVFSRNPIRETVRELTVVGGRGRFRMARGFVRVSTYAGNRTTGDAILQCNATIIHY